MATATTVVPSTPNTAMSNCSWGGWVEDEKDEDKGDGRDDNMTTEEDDEERTMMKDEDEGDGRDNDMMTEEEDDIGKFLIFILFFLLLTTILDIN
jgi:hypothetical protein